MAICDYMFIYFRKKSLDFGSSARDKTFSKIENVVQLIRIYFFSAQGKMY